MSLHHTEDAFELEDKRLTAAVPSMTTPASSDSNSNHDVDLEGKLPAAQHLRPTDGGVAAWRLLLAAFVFEALLWGFPTCFGVFQAYYSTLPQFSHNKHITLIGTVAQGISYLLAPLSTALTKRYPRYRKVQIYAGWLTCIASLLLASFATTITQLIATQGLLYGLGFVTLTSPIITLVDEWWVARKGMAFGLVSAASSSTGAALPFAVEALLSRHGYRLTLRASALALGVVTGSVLPFLQARAPFPCLDDAATTTTTTRTSRAFLKRPLFWFFAASAVAQGFALFFPALYLPSYAAAAGLSAAKGALLLALMSAAQVLGQLAFGLASDSRLPVSALAALSSLVATMATLLMWDAARSLPLLLGFSAVWGFFAYGFNTTRVAMGRAVSDDPATTVSIYSAFVFLQGIGNVCAGPVGAVLVAGSGPEKYTRVVMFTGACMFASAAVVGVYHLGRIGCQLARACTEILAKRDAKMRSRLPQGS